MRPSDNFTGRPLPGYGAGECILRREAADALKRVQADLAKENLGLKVYDCYRPTRAVRAMAAWAHDGDDSAATKRFYPELQKRNLFRLGYIAAQSKHSTGTDRRSHLDQAAGSGGSGLRSGGALWPLHRPGRQARARQQHRHGHRLRLLRPAQLRRQQGNFARAETLAVHAQRGHAPARLCELLPRMVALFVWRRRRATGL